MNLQSVVVVLLRLASLNFLIGVLVQLVPTVLEFMSRLRAGYAESSEQVLIWGLLVTCIVCAILLWVLAPGIARLVTNGTAQEISLGPLSLADCYSIAFMATGLFFAAGHLSGILYWIGYSLFEAARTPTDSWKAAINGYSVWRDFAHFTIGIALLVKGRRWAIALSRRDAGAAISPSPEKTNQI